MATPLTICSAPAPGLPRPAEPDVHEGRREYTPCIWGDFFLTHQPCTLSELDSMKKKVQALKEEVRLVVINAAASDDLTRKLDLIDMLQRLGVAYYYKKEIDELLRVVYDDKDSVPDELYVTSLRFYLLRKHGYAVPSDVFMKFRDVDGNITSDDANIVMILYDAAHLRTCGEDILDNIITFNKCRLQYMLETNLETALAEEVRITLETPRSRRIERVEARRFISVYEKVVARDDTILELAKLDYNIVQVLYCKELKELTVWWKDFKSRTDVRFVRDRLVEMYFWMMALVYEPYYTYSRVILTKLLMFVLMLDEVFDNYTTTEEGNIFITAIERWDEKAAEQLPANLREVYKNLICDTNEIVEELKILNNKNAELAIKVLIHLAKCYHAEAKWRDEQYIPKDVEEHLQISLGSIAAIQTISLALISLGNVITREDMEWTFTYPKPIKGLCVLSRLSNDIMSHEREQASEHMASTVQTCMKQYGVTAKEANEKLRVLIEKAWMDIIQGCLDQERSMVLLEKVVALAQSVDFIYKREDSFTIAPKLKDTLTLLYVKSI